MFHSNETFKAISCCEALDQSFAMFSGSTRWIARQTRAKPARCRFTCKKLEYGLLPRRYLLPLFETADYGKNVDN
jgi:hypothetical protein